MNDLKDYAKRLERAAKTLRELEKAGDLADDPLSLAKQARVALEGLDIATLRDLLANAERSLKERIDAQLAERRQGVSDRARELNLSYRRQSEADLVGAFSLKYSARKVRVLVGDEELTLFDEVDGRKVVDRLVAEKTRVDAMLLPRERFFQVLESALALADAEGKMAEHKVKVRDLFPCVVATRQLASDSFRNRPLAKNFVDYSLAMFAYELYQFGAGDQGWTCGRRRLSNRSPTMGTQHEALRLPDTNGNPTQVYLLWTE